ncbi:MAG: hypothetical protein ABI627_05295 [Polyangiaceae bacterium]
MKRSCLNLVPLALALLAANCSDSDVKSSNGVPSPEAGAAGAGVEPGGGSAGKTTSSAGSAGESTSMGGREHGGAAGDTEAGAAGMPINGGDAGSAGATMTPPVDTSTCGKLPGTVLYVESGDTQENLLKNIGLHLRDTANITVAFFLTGSCTLTSDMYAGAKVLKNGTLKYIPSTAEDPTWTVAKAEPTCTTGPDGVSLDLAISALFVDSCGLGPTPAGLGLIQGPIQAYTFVVPTASDQKAIWAQEAYYAFGFGASNPLATAYNPWNDPAFMFIRPPTKSTLVATAKNINVPPAKWKGTPEAASSDVVTAVKGSAQPEKSIGILGAEVYDGNRNNGIQTLAFQAFNQKTAYYPDSTSGAFDKQNVRDGHYTLWSPTVYIAPVGGSNVPTNPAVKYLTELVVGAAASALPVGATAFDALADVVKVGLIPECAMKVSRDTDGGALSVFSPANPCTCYYLSKVPLANGTPEGCTACTGNAGCGAGTCSHGFCEPDAVDSAGTSPGCYSSPPTTNEQIINACSNAQHITKVVMLPTVDLQPLP